MFYKVSQRTVGFWKYILHIFLATDLYTNFVLSIYQILNFDWKPLLPVQV